MAMSNRIENFNKETDNFKNSNGNFGIENSDLVKNSLKRSVSSFELAIESLNWKTEIIQFAPGMVAHTCNLRNWEAETGRSWIWAQSELHSKFNVDLHYISKPCLKKKRKERNYSAWGTERKIWRKNMEHHWKNQHIYSRIGVSEWEKSEKGSGKMSKEIMAVMSLKRWSFKISYIQEGHRVKDKCRDIQSQTHQGRNVEKQLHKENLESSKRKTTTCTLRKSRKTDSWLLITVNKSQEVVGLEIQSPERKKATN